MADVEEIEPFREFMTTCSGCKSSLAGKLPKLLPCLHSICSSCIQTQESNVDQNDRVRCPTCGEICPKRLIIDNLFVQPPEPNSSVTKDGDGLAHSCTGCEENTTGTSFCIDCVEWLCDACVSAHRRVRVTKDHAIKPRAEVHEDSQAAVRKIPFCKTHRQEQLKLYCETCCLVTCRDCQLAEQHKGHKHGQLDACCFQYKKVLELFKGKFKEKKSFYDGHRKDLKELETSFVEKEKTYQTNIEMALNDFINNYLVKRGKQLMSTLKVALDCNRVEVREKQKEVEKLQGVIEHCITTIENILSSGSDVALLQSRLVVLNRLKTAFQMHSQEQPRLINAELNLEKDLVELARDVMKVGTLQFDGTPFKGYIRLNRKSDESNPINQHERAQFMQYLNQHVVKHKQQQRQTVSQNKSTAERTTLHRGAAGPLTTTSSSSMASRGPPTLTPYPAVSQTRPMVRHNYNNTTPLTHLTQHAQQYGVGYSRPIGYRARSLSPNIQRPHYYNPYNQREGHVPTVHHPATMRMVTSPSTYTAAPHTAPQGNIQGMRQLSYPPHNVRRAFPNTVRNNIHIQSIQSMCNNQLVPNVVPAPMAIYESRPAIVSPATSPLVTVPSPTNKQESGSNGSSPMLAPHSTVTSPEASETAVLTSSQTSTVINYTCSVSPMQGTKIKVEQDLLPGCLESSKTDEEIGTIADSTTTTNVMRDGLGIFKEPDSVDKASLSVMCDEPYLDIPPASMGFNVSDQESVGNPESDATSFDEALQSLGPFSNPNAFSGDHDPTDPSEDYCAVCHNGGDLLCCDYCPKVFHLACHVPQLAVFPHGSWQCTICKPITFNSFEPEITDGKRKAPTGLSDRELQISEKILLGLFSHPAGSPFHEPVQRSIPNYYKVIKEPMDFTTVKSKLARKHLNHYDLVEEFIADLMLVFQNCATFNPEYTDIGQAGIQVHSYFKSLVKKHLPEYVRDTNTPNSVLSDESGSSTRSRPSARNKKHKDGDISPPVHIH